MKLIETQNIDDYIFEMANLVPKRTGLKVNIWSDHNGVERKIPHGARIKIGNRDYSVSVTIEKEPKIVAISTELKRKKKGSSEWKDIEEGISYVARNYDLFLKHFNDTTDDFDDKDLFEALEERGEFK